MTPADWAAAVVIVTVSAGIAALLSNVFGAVPYEPSDDDDAYVDDAGRDADEGKDADVADDEDGKRE